MRRGLGGGLFGAWRRRRMGRMGGGMGRAGGGMGQQGPVGGFPGRRPYEQPAGAEDVGNLETRAQASVAIRSFRVLQASGGRVGWRADGQAIALDKAGEDGYADVYTMRPDGSDLRCLTCEARGLPQANNGNPAWHPSGEYLVFQAEDSNLRVPRGPMARYLTSPGVGLNNNVWVMRADGSRFWQLTQVGEGQGALHPHFSEDGARVVWSQLIERRQRDPLGQWAIQMADISFSGGEVRLGQVQSLQPGGLQLYETHGFSPDGQSLLFSGIPRGGYYWDMEIYTWELATQRLNQLTDNDEWDEHAHFSKDGRAILWSSSEGNEAVKGSTPRDTLQNPPPLDLWIMGRDGGRKRRLTHFNDPQAPEFLNAGGSVGIGDWSLGPDGRTAVIRLRNGTGQRSETVALVEFEPQAMESS